MPTSEDRRAVDWRGVFTYGLLVIGIVLLAVSFAWTSWATGRSDWSDKQALEFQEASTRLHSLSHEFAHQAEHGKSDALRPQLEAAEARFGELRSQLEVAQNQPHRMAMIIRFTGLLMAIAGGALYATNDRG